MLKTKPDKHSLAAIGYPPKPVVMRWESWLYDALFYANNLPEVKTIVESFGKSNVLITQANSSLERPRLATQLFKIRDQYECLVKMIKNEGKCKVNFKRSGAGNSKSLLWRRHLQH